MSHLRSLHLRRRPAFDSYYWLLLLAGDVEANPGQANTRGARVRHYNIDRGARDVGVRAEPGFGDIVDPTKSN